MTADTVEGSDLIEAIEGLVIIISPKTYKLIPEVSISYVDDSGRKGLNYEL
jgi:hypothetical protein